MVLSRRATAADQAGPSLLVFDGRKDSKVIKFFFYYENVATRVKSSDEKATELLAYLEREAFDFYYENFGRDGEPLETDKDYNGVKKALIDRFSEELEPEQLIHEAVSARLSCDEMEESLRSIDLAYEKAGFNEKAKFGLFRSAVMEHIELAQFSILCGTVYYDELKEVIKDFSNGKKTFQSYNLSNKEGLTQAPRTTSRSSVGFDDRSPKKILARPDVRSSQLERKVDALADQLSQLTLFVKKKQNPVQLRQEIQGRTCSYCKKAGHGASQCDANPHRNTVCPRCRKRGHSESTCWVKITPEMTRKIDPRMIRSESETEMNLAAIAQREEEEQATGSHVSVVTEVNKGSESSAISSEKELVAAAKRTADGQAVPKQVKTSHPEILPIKQRVYPSFTPNAPIPANDPRVRNSKSRRRPRKKATKSKKGLQENSPQYHAISGLANALSGLTFGQLIRGDADDARRELRRLLKGVPRTGRTLAASAGNLAHRVKVVTVRVYGTNAQALLDSGAYRT